MAIEWDTTLIPVSSDFYVNYNNQTFTSAFTNRQTVIGYLGDYWTASLTFENLREDEQRAMTAMLGQLGGMVGTINVPTFKRYRTDNIGTPTVFSATRLTKGIVLQGVSPSAKVFSKGDYITILGELFEVTADATSTTEGLVTVNVNKFIRATISAGTAIEYQTPYCTMRLTDSKSGLSYTTIFGSTTVAFMEAF